jgi:mRNA interferase RelE/StbE
VPRYELELLASAKRELAALDGVARKRVAARIDGLRDDPRPSGSTKLVGSEYWRVRAGDYRVLYSIEDAKLFVLVVRVGHRREVYR